MKYKIINKQEEDLMRFVVEDGPNAGVVYSIKTIDQGKTDADFNVDYICESWPRGVLPPENKESEEIINFVFCDILKNILDNTKKENDESVQANKEE